MNLKNLKVGQSVIAARDPEEAYKELVSKRKQNIREAGSWELEEVEDELHRLENAKKQALKNYPHKDPKIYDEHIHQLKESLKIVKGK